MGNWIPNTMHKTKVIVTFALANNILVVVIFQTSLNCVVIFQVLSYGSWRTGVTPSVVVGAVIETTESAHLVPTSQPTQSNNNDATTGCSVALDTFYEYMLDERLSTLWKVICGRHIIRQSVLTVRSDVHVLLFCNGQSCLSWNVLCDSTIGYCDTLNLTCDECIWIFMITYESLWK